MAIGFHNSPKKNFPSKTILKKILNEMAAKEGFGLKSLQYIFVSDAELLEINQNYLNHDDYTDIITFDQSEEPEKIEGDIYISTERVEENGLQFEGTLEEFLRVMGHGFLHLCGYKDKTAAQSRKMREKEAEFIRLYFSNLAK
jgi:probable rRNA maturation factor